MNNSYASKTLLLFIRARILLSLRVHLCRYQNMANESVTAELLLTTSEFNKLCKLMVVGSIAAARIMMFPN